MATITKDISISVYGLLTGAMTGNITWIIPGYEPWALVNHLINKLHYFPSRLNIKVIEESVDDPWRAVFLAAIKDNRVDVVEWMNKEDMIDDLDVFNYGMQWAAYHGELVMVRWLVENSPQPLDCRELSIVHHDTFVTHPKAPQLNECRDYLKSVAALQDQVGLENWKEARDIKLQQKQRRRM